MGEQYCHHPLHVKIREESSKINLVYDHDGIKEPVKLPTDMYIKTPGWGLICVECWSYEMGNFVEKNPISADKETFKKFKEGKL